METTSSLPIHQIEQLILDGNAPAGLTVNGHLDLANHPQLTALPRGLTVKRLTLDGCSSLETLPEGLHCHELSMQVTPIRTLPADIQIDYRLDLSNCDMLVSLPTGLKVSSLILRGCASLRTLPDGLNVFFLDMPGCVSITDFPEHGPARMGRLNLRGCTRIRTLPSWLIRLAQLDVSGCSSMTSLPEGLQVSSWLDLANTPLQSLPASLQGVQLRWRDVFITERIAFQPELLIPQEVLDEPNAELRRVLLERIGYDRFFEQADAEVLAQDEDAGGKRRLLRVPMAGDEPLVCLAVQCPSTGRQYLIRVPPTIRSCHIAAAWIAGFDNPNDYRPLAET